MWTGFPLCAVHQARESVKSQHWLWKGIRFLIPLLPHTDSWSLSPQSLLEGSSLGSCCVDSWHSLWQGVRPLHSHPDHASLTIPNQQEPHILQLFTVQPWDVRFSSEPGPILKTAKATVWWQGRGWLTLTMTSTNNGHGRYLTTGRFYQMILARKFFPVELKSADLTMQTDHCLTYMIPPQIFQKL